MPDLYKEVILELERRRVAYVRDFAPFYISSLATHVFNIVNQQKRILVEAGLPVNTRQHILFVTVPGFGKTFILRQFIENEAYSILAGSDVQCTFESTITEAGLTGSIGKDKNGTVTKTMGLASDEGNAIIGIEEFSAITSAMVQQYNAGLDTALLTALDSGMVRKRMANGKLEYQTNFTLWTGVQPARFNLSSGLGRRFLFLRFTPTWKDLAEFRRRRRAAKNIRVNYPILKQLRSMLNQRFKEIQNNVTKIRFNADFYAELDKHKIIHYEEPIYERLALGYWLMHSDKLYGELDIHMDLELKRIIELEKAHRKGIKEGPHLNLVWTLIKDAGKVHKKELLEMLLEFSLDWDTARALINTLIALRKVRVEGEWLIVVK